MAFRRVVSSKVSRYSEIVNVVVASTVKS